MQFLRATVETARQCLILQLKSRVLYLLLLASVALSAVAVIAAQDDTPMRGRDLFAILGFWMYLVVMVPWSALFFGVYAVHGDIEDRTFQYLFLRPVPRPALVLGKWIAAALLTTAIAVAGLIMLFLMLVLLGIDWAAGSPEWQALLLFVGVAAVASFAYTAVAAFFGAFFRRPMIWGVFFIVGFEMFVSNLPPQAGVRALTIADPVRRLLMDGLEPGRRLARALWPSQRDWDPETLGNPQGNLALIICVCLAAALWRYSRTEYDSRPRE